MPSPVAVCRLLSRHTVCMSGSGLQDVVLVRHGQSEGNLLVKSAYGSNPDLYNQLVDMPDNRVRLTPAGVTQAQLVGAWLRQEFPYGFARHVVSPYVRAVETAGHLGLEDASWRISRTVRERDKGDVQHMPEHAFLSSDAHRDSARTYVANPVYWRAPGGEAMADVAQNRVSRLLDDLSGPPMSRPVLVVTHGRFMQAFQAVVEGLDDEQFRELFLAGELPNGSVLHYTCQDPFTGEVSEQYSWSRVCTPGGSDDAGFGQWRQVNQPVYTSSGLLDMAAKSPRLLT